MLFNLLPRLVSLLGRVLSITLLALLLNAGTALGGGVLLTTGEWPPFSSGNMPDGGLGTEIVTAAFRAVGITPKVEFLPWMRTYNMMARGRVQGSFPWGIIPQRQKECLFSEPLFDAKFVFFYLKSRFPDGFGFKTMADVKPYKIGASSGYWYDEFFKQHELQAEYGSHIEFAFRKLIKERVDLVPEEELAGWYKINEIFPGQAHLFAATRDVLIYKSQHLLLPKVLPESEELVARFNRGLRIIKHQGIYQAIAAKYLPQK